MDTKSIFFLAIMIAIGAAALVAFLVFLYSRAAPRLRAAGAPAADEAAAAAAAQPSPSGARLIGLLLLLVALLLLMWLHLPKEGQLGLLLNLFYPAVLGVALVLLFDKACRSWSVKGGAETVREWLLCDGIVFLLVLGYLNLSAVAAPEKYGAGFWDVLYLAAFFFVFWLLDRKLTRYRFFACYVYLILLPILLLIWRAVQGFQVPEELSWWSGIWPFFFWAVIASVVEVLTLAVFREGSGHPLGAVKDALFVLGYAILLLVARS